MDMGGTTLSPAPISRKNRNYIIAASLLALFLGALDAMVMSAAMPTIVADLGGLALYSWVFSAYLLARAVSLPIFGKLADLLQTRTLYSVAIAIFLAGSLGAGLAHSMFQLILSRAIQGIGAGGNFALVYIVLADISPVHKRGKTMSLASFIWGLASVLGPTFGGFVVSYFSWRWIFFFNLPLGILSFSGIGLYLIETRQKRRQVSIDYCGALFLTMTILSLLMAFLISGRNYHWISPQVMSLLAGAVLAGIAFFLRESSAQEPILSLEFFRLRGFSTGNGASFCSSFAIFSLFAYSPLFIQGTLGKTPLQLGTTMLSLSLGWSAGALLCGQLTHRLGEKPLALAGSLCLVTGSALSLTFSGATSLIKCSLVLGLAGTGMGFVSIATLLIVQNSLDSSDLGIATASQQFARTLGGAIGVGVSGGVLTAGFSTAMQITLNGDLAGKIPPALQARFQQHFENLFQPEMLAQLSADVQKALRAGIDHGVTAVFWVALIASVLTLGFALMLPGRKKSAVKIAGR